jgi:hypothetical protein
MTDLKISELEDGGSSQAADVIPIARSGQNYYVTSQYLKNFVFGSNGTIAIAAGKTFSVNNTITLNGNDGVSVNFGSGGTFIYSGGDAGTPSSITLTNGTGLPLTSGVAGTLPVANGGTGVTTSTGSGNVVLSTSPTLVTPALGTPTSGNFSTGTFTWPTFNQNTTGTAAGLSATLAVASGGTGITSFGTGIATWLGTPSSANLASAVTDETGSGPLVFATSPTFTSQVTFGTSSSTRGTLVLANTSANTVTLQSSNSTAANYTLTFPAAAPVNGYYLQTDVNGVLSWAAGGGGGSGSPGGSNTQVQFNNAGTFGGDAAFTFVNGTGTATMSLGVASTTSAALKLYNSSSANSVSIASGNNTASWTMTLPPDDGSANQFLQTDGSGNTIWAAAAAGTINTGTVGQITYYSGTNTLSGTTTGTGVLTAISYNTNSASGLPVLNGSGFLAVAQGGTATGTAGIGAFNNITGYTASGATGTTSTNLVFSTSPTITTPTITTPTISGNETHTGTAARFLADFDNATVADRFSFQTSTTNGTTGIYALPNGNSTGAAWQATNNSDPTNASKIMITTNASTDVQLVSGINGTGTYLPLSIYTSGGKSAEFSTTKGTFELGVSGSTQGILNLDGVTAGTVSIQGAASAGTWTFTLPTSGGTANYALTTNGSGTSSWSQISLTAGVTGTLPVANGGTGLTSGTSGGVLYYSATGTLASSAALAANALVIGGGVGVAPSTTTTGAGILTFLGTPSSANLATAVTDETGSGSLVFATTPTLSNPTVTNYVETYFNIGTVTSTVTLDLANGTFQNLTLTSATALTVTMPTATAGKSFILIVRQPASGTATTVTFTGVKWPASTAPTITATLSRADIISFFSDGTNWYGSAVQNFTP